MKFDSISELKSLISEKYSYRTELHAHSHPVSRCGDFPPEEVVKKYADIGYDAIALTNHFTYDYRYRMFEKEPTAEEFVKWYMSDFYKARRTGKELGINVILGAEIRFEGNINDYLVYGINEDILVEIYDVLPYGLEEFRKSEELKDVVLVQAHPYRDGIERVNPKLLDGVEIFNMHCGHNQRNALSVKFAKENNLGILTAGSDFHHESGEGMAALRTAVLPNDSFELAKILLSQDYAFDIADNSIIIP